MLILTDCAERLAGFLPPGASWSQAQVGSLPACDQALWRTLASCDRVSRGLGPDPGPAGFWSRALIVGEAAASQFDSLRELLGSGLTLPGPTACLALSGRGFHGQRGRPWLAAAGNLHLCAVFPSPGLAARDAVSMTMLPAVALVEAVRAMTGGTLRPGIKWVNDVLLDDRKIGGVLTATQTQRDRLSAILVGIGLNLAAAPPAPPTPFVPAVGCLAEAGAKVTTSDAFASVLAALGERLTDVLREGPQSLLDAYREASLVIGREVCLWEESTGEGPGDRPWPPPFARGTVRGIATDLSLILEGMPTPVVRGRLAFAESCRLFGL